jgi:hypothetical protein
MGTPSGIIEDFENDLCAIRGAPTSAHARGQQQAPVARVTSSRVGHVSGGMMKDSFVGASHSQGQDGGVREAGFAFKRCIYLGKAEIVRASAASRDCRALLEHFAVIAKPHDGAPLLLLLFARLATVACDWLDGDLFILMEARRPWSTVVTVATELGSGMREKVFPSIELAVPLDEFTGAVARIPQMVHPLVAEIARDQLLLSASEHVRTSAIPQEVVIDEALFEGTAPPSSSRIWWRRS